MTRQNLIKFLLLKLSDELKHLYQNTNHDPTDAYVILLHACSFHENGPNIIAALVFVRDVRNLAYSCGQSSSPEIGALLKELIKTATIVTEELCKFADDVAQDFLRDDIDATKVDPNRKGPLYLVKAPPKTP